LVTVALVATACGAGSDDGEASSVTSATTEPVLGSDTATPSPAATVDPPSSSSPDAGGDEVVVSLGEEFLLADLLALGVTPVASTATVPTAGFQGLEQFATEDIDALPSTELNLERIAAYRPDVIVTTRFVADEVGDALLAELGDVVVVEDDATAEEQLLVLADRFGATDAADQLLADLEAARGELAAQVAAQEEPCVVSLATVYPGPSPTAWTTGAADLPAALLDAGCTLRPGVDAGEPDRNGRLFLSLEQLGLLDAPRLVLLQSDTVDGEAEAVAELVDDPLWAALPAVANGQVVTLDRLAYPGVVGQIALNRDLVDAVTT
jgi:iron complex transport system substrate-binding protein